MKEQKWEPIQRIELEFQRALRAAMKRMLELAGSPDPLVIAADLTAMSQRGWFTEWAQKTATKMITGLAWHNAQAWREAAQEGMRGREIFAALQEEMRGSVGARMRVLIDENALVIRSLPQSLAEHIVKHVEQETIAGRRASDIASDIKAQLPEMTSAKAQLIARTEVSKTQTALVQTRSEAIGAGWYVWRSSEDRRVRPSHRLMSSHGGIIVSWADPPAPEALASEKSTLGRYHAGCCPNCRCYPRPLLRLSDVGWPHRVYVDGRIASMTRAEFGKLSGAELQRA